MWRGPSWSVVVYLAIVVPGRIAVPLIVALDDPLESASRFGIGGVWAEAILVAATIAAFDSVVLQTEPVLRGLTDRGGHVTHARTLGSKPQDPPHSADSAADGPLPWSMQ